MDEELKKLVEEAKAEGASFSEVMRIVSDFKKKSQVESLSTQDSSTTAEEPTEPLQTPSQSTDEQVETIPRGSGQAGMFAKAFGYSDEEKEKGSRIAGERTLFKVFDEVSERAKGYVTHKPEEPTEGLDLSSYLTATPVYDVDPDFSFKEKGINERAEDEEAVRRGEMSSDDIPKTEAEYRSRYFKSHPKYVEVINENYRQAVGSTDPEDNLLMDYEGSITVNPTAAERFDNNSSELSDWYRGQVEAEADAQRELGEGGRFASNLGRGGRSLLESLFLIGSPETIERNEVIRGIESQAVLLGGIAENRFGKMYSELSDDEKMDVATVVEDGIVKSAQEGNYEDMWTLAINQGVQQIPQIAMILAAPEVRLGRGMLSTVGVAGARGTVASRVVGASTFARRRRLLEMATKGRSTGLPLLGISAGSHKYSQIYENPSLSTASKIAIAAEVGAMEYFLEKIGYRMTEGALANTIRRSVSASGRRELRSELISALDKARSGYMFSLRQLGGMGKAIGTEALEEAGAGVNEAIVDKIFFGEEINPYEIYDQAAIGGLMGFGMGSLNSIVQTVSYLGENKVMSKRAKLIKALNEDVNLLRTEELDTRQRDIVKRRVEKARQALLDMDKKSSTFYSLFEDEDLAEVMRLNQEMSRLVDEMDYEKNSQSPNEDIMKQLKAEFRELVEQKASIENRYAEQLEREAAQQTVEEDGREIVVEETDELVADMMGGDASDISRQRAEQEERTRKEAEREIEEIEAQEAEAKAQREEELKKRLKEKQEERRAARAGSEGMQEELYEPDTELTEQELEREMVSQSETPIVPPAPMPQEERESLEAKKELLRQQEEERRKGESSEGAYIGAEVWDMTEEESEGLTPAEIAQLEGERAGDKVDVVEDMDALDKYDGDADFVFVESEGEVFEREGREKRRADEYYSQDLTKTKDASKRYSVFVDGALYSMSLPAYVDYLKQIARDGNTDVSRFMGGSRGRKVGATEEQVEKMRAEGAFLDVTNMSKTDAFNELDKLFGRGEFAPVQAEQEAVEEDVSPRTRRRRGRRKKVKAYEAPNEEIEAENKEVADEAAEKLLGDEVTQVETVTEDGKEVKKITIKQPISKRDSGDRVIYTYLTRVGQVEADEKFKRGLPPAVTSITEIIFKKKQNGGLSKSGAKIGNKTTVGGMYTAKGMTERLLDVLDSAIEKTSGKGKAMDATLAIPMFAVHSALKVVRAAVKAGLSLNEAIRKGYNFLAKQGYTEKDVSLSQWDSYVRNDILQKKKGDSQEEQQVPSPESERQATEQAEPVSEESEETPPTDRDVQEDEPETRREQRRRIRRLISQYGDKGAGSLIAAINSVERFLKNMNGFGRVIILDNEEYIEKRNSMPNVDKSKTPSSKGFANFEDGNIYLNSKFFTTEAGLINPDAITTVRHEGAEMAIKKYFKESGNDVTKAVSNVIQSIEKIAKRKTGEEAEKLSNLVTDLKRWSEQYDNTDKPYEFMAEFMAIMSDNSMYMQSDSALRRVYNSFINFIRNAMRKAGFRLEYSRSEVESLINNVTQGIRTGEMSKYFAVEPLQGTAPVVGISDRFTEENGLTTTPLETVKDIVLESGKVGEVFSTKPKKKGLSRISVNQVEDIRKFNGLNVVVHQPDGAGVMTVTNQNGDVIFQGQGGMFFPLEFEAFWASTENAAKEMTKLLNEALVASEDGRVGLALVRSGLPKKVLSSTNGVEGATRLLIDIVRGSQNLPVTEQDMVKILKHAANTAFTLSGEFKGVKAERKKMLSNGQVVPLDVEEKYQSLNAISRSAAQLEIDKKTGKPKWDKPNMSESERAEAKRAAEEAAEIMSQTFSDKAMADAFAAENTLDGVLQMLIETKFPPDQSSFQQRLDFMERVSRYLVGNEFKVSGDEFSSPTEKIRAERVQQEKRFLKSISNVRKNGKLIGETLKNFFNAGSYSISQNANSQTGLMNNLGNVLNEPIIRRMFSFSDDASYSQTSDHVYAVVEFKVDDVKEFKKRKAEGKTDFLVYVDSEHRTYGKQIVVNPDAVSGELSVNVLNKTSHWAENTNIPMLGKSIFDITEQDVFDIKFNKDFLRGVGKRRTNRQLDEKEKKQYKSFIDKLKRAQALKNPMVTKRFLMAEYLSSVMSSTAGVTTEFLKLSNSDFITSVNSEFFPSQINREKVISEETGLTYRDKSGGINYNSLFASFKNLLMSLNAPAEVMENGTDEVVSKFLKEKVDEYKLTLDKRTDKMLNALVNEESPTSVSQKFQVDTKPLEYAEPSFVKGAGRVFTVDGGRLEIAKGKESGAFMIMSLNVEEGKRRQGRAEALLTEALKHTKGKLTGMASNDSAVRLNYKLGMRSYYNPSMSLEEVMMKRAESGGGYILMAPPSYIRSVPKEQRQEKKKEKPSRSIPSLRSLIEKTSKTIEFGVGLKQKHESGESRMDEEGLSYINSTLSEESSKLKEYINEMEQNPLNKQLEELIESKKELLRQVSDRMGGLISQDYTVDSMNKKPLEMRVRDFLQSMYRRFIYQDKVAMDALSSTTRQKERVQEKAQRMILKLHSMINENGEENRDAISTLLTKYLDAVEDGDLLMQGMLESDVRNLKRGDEMMETVKRLRNQIDIISMELAQEGFIENMNDELRTAIKDNKGKYLTTRYKIFEDENYVPSDDDIRAAEEAIYAEEMAKAIQRAGVLSEADERALRTKAKNDVRQLISKAKTVQQGFLDPEKMTVPSGSFKRRQDLPEYIQNLYGLERNPVKRLQQTISIVSNIRQKAGLHALLRDGLSTGIISRYEHAQLNSSEQKKYKQVTSDFSPLNGYFVENNLNEYLKNSPLYNTDNRMLSAYFSLLTGMRMAQTVLNPNTWRKNYLGGLYTMFANGIFMNREALSDIKNRVVRFAKGEADAEIEELFDEMSELGVTGGSIVARALIGDIADLYDLDVSNKNATQRAVRKIASLPQTAGQRYGAVDDYTKLVIYRRNREFFAEAEYGRSYESLSDSQKDKVKKMAADRTVDNAPSLQRLPQFYRDIMRYGIFGNFLSFKFEAIRSFTAIVKNAVGDVKKGMSLISKGQAERGARYLRMGTSNMLAISTLATVNSVGYGVIASMVAKVFGLGDDEDDRERKEQVNNMIQRTDALKPSWMKDANTIVKEIKRDGTVTVMNMSTEDPYDEMLNLLGALLGVKEGYKVGDFLERQARDIFAPTMTLGTLKEIWDNENQWGEKIAQDDMEMFGSRALYKTYTYLRYSGRQFVPSSFRYGTKQVEDGIEQGENPFMLAGKTLPKMFFRDYSFNMPLQFKYNIDSEFSQSSTPWSALTEDGKRLRLERLEDYRNAYLTLDAISETTGNREIVEKAAELVQKNRTLDKAEKLYLLTGYEPELTPAIEGGVKYEAMRAIEKFVHENDVKEFKEEDFQNVMKDFKLEGDDVDKETMKLRVHMEKEVRMGNTSTEKRRELLEFMNIYNNVKSEERFEGEYSEILAVKLYEMVGDIRTDAGYVDGAMLKEQVEAPMSLLTETPLMKIDASVLRAYRKMLQQQDAQKP